jgi:hypothetical protein
MLSIGLVAGSVARTLWPTLRHLRNRGAPGHYVAWMISLSVAGTAVMLPGAISYRNWLGVLLGFFLGALAGLGMAAYTRYLGRSDRTAL